MTDDELLLPSGAVLLHIGPYKTGSTAIQSAMFARRDEMDQYGVSYPGNWRRLFHIGHALLRWAPRAFQVPDVSRWDDFAADVRATTDRRVCISTEDFGRIREPERTRKIVQDLGADRLHVIAVARAYHRLLPSQWQERVKSHGVDGYDEWLRLVLGDDEEAEAHRSFRTSHDVAWMTSMWLPHLPPERFTIVVTDDSDRGLLPRTFEQMLGLPDGFLTLDDNSNASLSFEATEMLRGVNEVFERQGWSARPTRATCSVASSRRFKRVPAPRSRRRSRHSPPGRGMPCSSAARSGSRRSATRASTWSVTSSFLLPPEEADAPPGVPDVDALSTYSAVTAVVGVLDAALRREQDLEAKLARARRRAHRGERVADTSSRALLKEVLRRQRRRLPRPAGRQGRG